MPFDLAMSPRQLMLHVPSTTTVYFFFHPFVRSNSFGTFESPSKNGGLSGTALNWFMEADDPGLDARWTTKDPQKVMQLE
jgi:hypothetical protein